MNAAVPTGTFVLAVVMATAHEWHTRTGKGSSTRRRALEAHLHALTTWVEPSPTNFDAWMAGRRTLIQAMDAAGVFANP